MDSRSITTAAWPPHQRSECGAFVDHAIIPQEEAEGGLAVTVLSGPARDIAPDVGVDRAGAGRKEDQASCWA